MLCERFGPHWKNAMPNGLLLTDKPEGVRSTDCVARVRRAFGRGTRIGHAGTLNSTASGLLVVLIGSRAWEPEASVLPESPRPMLPITGVNAQTQPKSVFYKRERARSGQS